MIIAIDGPAAAGKSTIARLLARELGLVFLDTGAMYRAVTLEVLRRELDPADARTCEEVARSLELEFDAGGHIRIDGRSGEPEIRSVAVDAAVSAVSAHAGVRRAIVPLQRAIARRGAGVVAEGRDTATVVFPDADHKFFLTASVAERARRRALQRGRMDELAAIRADIVRRDTLDSERGESPLRLAPGAEEIDTDGLAIPDVVRALLGRVRPAPRHEPRPRP